MAPKKDDKKKAMSGLPVDPASPLESYPNLLPEGLDGKLELCCFPF